MEAHSRAHRERCACALRIPRSLFLHSTQFNAAVFGWSFQDWGPDYVSFNGAGIDGGFAMCEPHEGPVKFAPLVVLYSADLKATEAAIVAAGGSIVVPTFEFPGGRRFHFSDGAGNVLAVWSE